MTLLSGLRLLVAPNFHIEVDWPNRVQLGARAENTAHGLVPVQPWRPASTEELAILVLPESVAPMDFTNSLCLFVIPVHLRTSFWNMLARSSEHGAIPPGEFSEFAAKLSSFLDFKGLPLPAGACCDLVVKRPESTPLLEESSWWGLVNLGEDAISFVYLNAPASNIPVRFQLAPGEGVRIPAGMCFACDKVESEQPIVLLSIRLPEQSAAE
jgi:hypothetical protein